MIDARTHHDPDAAPGLIDGAIRAAGTQNELAERLGMTRQYVRMVRKGEKTMSYGMQVMLEGIVAETAAPTPVSTPSY